MKDEFFVSIDVESDGPIPGDNSMLSFGAVALSQDGKILGKFSRNLELLEGAKPNPDTMDFWAKNKEAWDATRKNTIAPSLAMQQFVDWVNKIPGRPALIGYPITYDFMFVYWYIMKFVGKSPFSHSGLDIKTYAMAMLKGNYRDSTKKHMPRRWFPNVKHTHIAEDDALEQGLLFINMLKENLAK